MPANQEEQSASLQNAVIIARLDGIKADMGELKTSVSCIDKNYQALNTEWNREHAKVVIKVDNVVKRTEEVEELYIEVKEKLEALTTTMEIVKARVGLMLWAGGIIAGAAILYGINAILKMIFPGVP